MALTTLGVEGPRRGAIGLGYLFGAISEQVGLPFTLDRALVGKRSFLPFWMEGDFSAVLSTPFLLDGPIVERVALPFLMLDGSMGVYDEGGLAMPLLGWYDPWED